MTTRVGPKRIRPRPAPFETNRIDFDTARNHCLANCADIKIRRRLGAVAFVRVFYVPTTELSSLDRSTSRLPTTTVVLFHPGLLYQMTAR